MITLLYAGLCTLLVLYLAGRVIAGRRGKKVGIGDGGDHELQRRIRVHANAIEYLPLALILLGGMELNGYPVAVIHAFGVLLLISRLLHAWGLSRHSGVSHGRFIGTLFTLLLMVSMALLAVVGYFEQALAGDPEPYEAAQGYDE
jgi:uncharacterized membrane protein YecN with MAPEG domain